MSGKAILFLVVGIVITCAVIFRNIEAGGTAIEENFNGALLNQAGRNIAQTGVCMGLRKLADSSAWRRGFPTMNLLGGSVRVLLFDTTFKGTNVVRVTGIATTSIGSSSQASDTCIAYVFKGPGPIPLKGAVTTNAATKFGGGITVDGRDHDTSGALIPNSGTFGAWSTSTISIGGTSTIAGTTMFGVDKSPAGKLDTSITRQNQTLAGGFPTTPDQVAGGSANGYPDGTLKSFAQSHLSGGQYVTNPSGLTYPLSGVTYVELASGATWSPRLSGNGILIVHNTSVNATLKQPSGSFTGIIMTDDLTNLSGLILIGAIVQMTPTPSSLLFGSSNGAVTFSRAAILNATKSIGGTGGTNGSASNVLAWWE
jgi:hypothetical protein